MEYLVAACTVVALAAAGGAIYLAIRWARAERALALAKGDLRVARTDNQTLARDRDMAVGEGALERQRAKEQIAALIVDLETARADLAKCTTPDAARDRLDRSLRRAREALGALGAAAGARAARLPGDDPA